MKTRFRKVWCSSCSTMQFAGECPHAQQRPRIAWPAGVHPMALTIADASTFGVTFSDHVGASGKNGPQFFPFGARRCSCPLCLGGERRC